MSRKIFLSKQVFFLITIISTLFLLGCLVSLRMRPRQKHLDSTIAPGSIRPMHRDDISSLFRNETPDFITRKRRKEVFEALIEDGLQPVALSRTCQYRTTFGSQLTTRIPTPLAAATSRLTSVRDSRDVTSSSESLISSGKGENFFCEEKRILSHLQSEFLVPNVVHYVFIGSDFQFKFITYLSMLSAHRFLQPDQIFIHGDVIPSGQWWNTTIDQVRNIFHVPRNYSEKAPNGQPFKFKAHISDYIRAEVLVRYGGIYLDPDVLILKSFDPLRRRGFVLGRESEDSVGNGIILARRQAPFLHLMLEQYWSYTGPDEEWAKQSVHNVHKLALIYPHLVHVEEKSLNRPNWMERTQIYDGNYDWKAESYAMHLWLRLWPKEKVPSSVDDVKNINTTIGSIARHILRLS